MLRRIKSMKGLHEEKEEKKEKKDKKEEKKDKKEKDKRSVHMEEKEQHHHQLRVEDEPEKNEEEPKVLIRNDHVLNQLRSYCLRTRILEMRNHQRGAIRKEAWRKRTTNQRARNLEWKVSL